MNKKHGIIKQAKPQFPVRELLVVPHKEQEMTIGFPAFGTNTYRGNLEDIQELYSHPVTGEQISFRPATTSEAISAVAYDFGTGSEADAKKSIFDPRWLQAGYIVKTQDGIFTNTDITDESQLKSLLDNAQKVNGIYLLNNGIGFAPYETFERGVQDVDTFAQGGLARVLEHTTEKEAGNLRKIASPKLYKKGVHVWGLDDVKEPILRVASLDSVRDLGDDRLGVDGNGWYDDGNGCAFGVSE